MKTSKSKRNTNSSFLSNHDLLQNFRNKSFKLISRDASISQFKVSKKVSLIQKKSYQNINKQNKQNDPLISNRKKANVLSKETTYRQKGSTNFDSDFNKIIKELNFIYDQINCEQIELRMILNKNIRKIKELFLVKAQNLQNISNKNSNQIDLQKISKQKIDFLQNKVEQQSKKIFKQKKENQQLKEKVQIYEKRITNLQSKLDEQKYFNIKKSIPSNQLQSMLLSCSFQNPLDEKTKSIVGKDKNYHQQNQVEILQKIIVSQEELINKQSFDYQIENQQLLRLIKCQALNIQNEIFDKEIHEQFKPKSIKTEIRQNRHQSSQSPYRSQFDFISNRIQNKSLGLKCDLAHPHKNIIGNSRKEKKKQSQVSICLY